MQNVDSLEGERQAAVETKDGGTARSARSLCRSRRDPNVLFGFESATLPFVFDFFWFELFLLAVSCSTSSLLSTDKVAATVLWTDFLQRS